MAQNTTQTGLHLVPLFDKTVGVNDALSDERIPAGALALAEDVVIDNSGAIKSRGKVGVLQSGKWHSLFSCGKFGFGVVNGVLNSIKVVSGSVVCTPLYTVGDSKAGYAYIDGVTYFSNSVITGKIVNDVFSLWVTPAYVGPSSTDVKTTDYLPSPPVGNILEIFNGRLFTALGKILRFSEIYDFSRFKGLSEFWFDTDVTMVVALQSGLFVGTTDKVFFFLGSGPDEMTLIEVSKFGAIPGTAAKKTATDVKSQTKASIVIFSTSDGGICLGEEGGTVTNLTSAVVEFQKGSSGAGYITPTNHYIVSIGE